MTFRDQLQEAADTGRQQRINELREEATARAAAEQQRLRELSAKVLAAMDILQPLIGRMQVAARKDETMCAVHTVPICDINLPAAVNDRCPLRATSLVGVSLHLFNLLEEMGLLPIVAVAGPNVYELQIPVLPQIVDPLYL